jgi:hypothetical protein
METADRNVKSQTLLQYGTIKEHVVIVDHRRRISQRVKQYIRKLFSAFSIPYHDWPIVERVGPNRTPGVVQIHIRPPAYRDIAPRFKIEPEFTHFLFAASRSGVDERVVDAKISVCVFAHQVKVRTPEHTNLFAVRQVPNVHRESVFVCEKSNSESDCLCCFK